MHKFQQTEYFGVPPHQKETQFKHQSRDAQLDAMDISWSEAGSAHYPRQPCLGKICDSLRLHGHMGARRRHPAWTRHSAGQAHIPRDELQEVLKKKALAARPRRSDMDSHVENDLYMARLVERLVWVGLVPRGGLC